jgi:hypothetical protein
MHQSQPARRRSTERHRSRNQRDLGTGSNDAAEVTQLAQNWYVEQPSKRTNHPTLAADGDVEKRSNNRGVKLGPRTARQLLSRVLR